MASPLPVLFCRSSSRLVRRWRRLVGSATASTSSCATSATEPSVAGAGRTGRTRPLRIAAHSSALPAMRSHSSLASCVSQQSMTSGWQRSQGYMRADRWWTHVYHTTAQRQRLQGVQSGGRSHGGRTCLIVCPICAQTLAYASLGGHFFITGGRERLACVTTTTPASILKNCASTCGDTYSLEYFVVRTRSSMLVLYSLGVDCHISYFYLLCSAHISVDGCACK